jgi:hypothetical protein
MSGPAATLFDRAVKLSTAIVDCFEKKAEGVKSNARESVCGVAVNTKGLLGEVRELIHALGQVLKNPNRFRNIDE